MRTLALLILSFALTACGGWKPVHVNQNNQIAPDSRLGQIDIASVYSINGQNMYNALLDQFAKFPQKAEKPYRLSFSTSISSQSQTRFTDGTASLTLKRYTARYTLSHGSKKKSFTSSTATSVSQDNSPYNNTVLNEKADQQAMNVLAQAISKRIAVFLRKNPQW